MFQENWYGVVFRTQWNGGGGAKKKKTNKGIIVIMFIVSSHHPWLFSNLGCWQ